MVPWDACRAVGCHRRVDVNVDPNVDEVTDVVVVGLGSAGATTAMTAHDEGARVLVLERQAAEDHRPNSRYAAGFVMVPTDPVLASTYLRGLYAVNGEDADIDPELIDTWVTEASTIPAWFDAHGCRHQQRGTGAEHGSIEGAEAFATYQVTHADGVAGCPLYAFLADQVAARGIEVRWQADVTRLLTDDGRVVGVEYRDAEGRVHELRAASVVLSTGGYEADEQLKRRSLPVWPVHFLGTRRNDGTGIRLATEAGADLWHMNNWPGRLVAHVPDSGYEGGVSVRMWGSPDAQGPTPGGIFVDRQAVRFMSEPGLQHHAHLHVWGMDAQRLQHPAIPAWWVFDRRRIEAGPLPPTNAGAAGPVADLTWSDDNQVEVERGWIQRAPTISALADGCALDPQALEETVARYNAACAAGVDEDFGRDATTLTALDQPPYFAVSLWPGGTHTVGGPRRDARGRVLRHDGSSIDGLYACGEMGSMYGFLYPSGGASLTECLVFGRLIGHEVAARSS